MSSFLITILVALAITLIFGIFRARQFGTGGRQYLQGFLVSVAILLALMLIFAALTGRL